MTACKNRHDSYVERPWSPGEASNTGARFRNCKTCCPGSNGKSGIARPRVRRTSCLSFRQDSVPIHEFPLPVTPLHQIRSPQWTGAGADHPDARRRHAVARSSGARPAGAPVGAHAAAKCRAQRYDRCGPRQQPRRHHGAARRAAPARARCEGGSMQPQAFPFGPACSERAAGNNGRCVRPTPRIRPRHHRTRLARIRWAPPRPPAAAARPPRPARRRVARTSLRAWCGHTASPHACTAPSTMGAKRRRTSCSACASARRGRCSMRVRPSLPPAGSRRAVGNDGASPLADIRQIRPRHHRQLRPIPRQPSPTPRVPPPAANAPRRGPRARTWRAPACVRGARARSGGAHAPRLPPRGPGRRSSCSACDDENLQQGLPHQGTAPGGYGQPQSSHDQADEGHGSGGGARRQTRGRHCY